MTATVQKILVHLQDKKKNVAELVWVRVGMPTFPKYSWGMCNPLKKSSKYLP